MPGLAERGRYRWRIRPRRALPPTVAAIAAFTLTYEFTAASCLATRLIFRGHLIRLLSCAPPVGPDFQGPGNYLPSWLPAVLAGVGAFGLVAVAMWRVVEPWGRGTAVLVALIAGAIPLILAVTWSARLGPTAGVAIASILAAGPPALVRTLGTGIPSRVATTIALLVAGFGSAALEIVAWATWPGGSAGRGIGLLLFFPLLTVGLGAATAVLIRTWSRPLRAQPPSDALKVPDEG
jgi:hypothetical protein